MADESEANVAGKLDTRSESRKRAFDHHDMLDTWMPGAVVIGLLYTYFTTIQAVIAVEGADWLLRHFILSYEIKYTAGRLSCIHSKSQQLWLIRSALDRGETYLDELLAVWFFQVQQICRQRQPIGARNKLPNNQRNWATPRSIEFNRPNMKFNKS